MGDYLGIVKTAELITLIYLFGKTKLMCVGPIKSHYPRVHGYEIWYAPGHGMMHNGPQMAD